VKTRQPLNSDCRVALILASSLLDFNFCFTQHPVASLTGFIQHEHEGEKHVALLSGGKQRHSPKGYHENAQSLHRFQILKVINLSWFDLWHKITFYF